MTNCRIKSALLAGLIALVPLPLAAQDDTGAPVQLPSIDGQPIQTEDNREAPQAVPSRPGARDLGIQVGVISTRAPLVGTLSQSAGLGARIWSGTSATTAQILLNQIPVGAPSAAMSDLLRRLLLGASEPPSDPRGGDPIVRLRIERAFAAGFLDAVPEMIGQATHLTGDPDLEQFRAEALLLRGGGEDACTGDTPLRFETEDPFWMKLRAYCFQFAGLTPAARLTADLLYDIGDEDELFQILLERLAGVDGVPVSPHLSGRLSAIHLAMMRDAGITPPAGLFRSQTLSVARSVAMRWRESDEHRALAVQMGERAAASGALSTAELVELYGATTNYDPANRTSELGAAARSATPVSRGVMLAAAASDTLPGSQAEVLTAAVGIAGEDEFAATYAAALGLATRNLRPDPTIEWAALAGALTALAAGNSEAGYGWFDFLTVSESTPPYRVQSLRAAMMMTQPSERYAFYPGQALLWLELSDLGEFDHARLTAQMTIYSAMGYPVPEEVLSRLTLHEDELSGSSPQQATLDTLFDAAANGRIGETVAASLIAIGPDGPSGTHPLILGEVISALRQIGLEDDARAIAGEALLAMALDDID